MCIGVCRVHSRTSFCHRTLYLLNNDMETGDSQLHLKLGANYIDGY